MPLSNSMPLVLGVQRYELFYKISRKAASNQIIFGSASSANEKAPHRRGFLNLLDKNQLILVTLAAPVLLVFTLVGLPRYLISGHLSYLH